MRPDLGGCVTRCRYNGRDVLRPAPADLKHSGDSGMFVLAPFSNRIAGGVVAYNGENVSLCSQADFAELPIHGTVWHEVWVPQDGKDRGLSLICRHHSDRYWPWSFVTEQTITAAEAALRFELSVTNTDSRPMPAGIGFHPFFPAEDTCLQFSAEGVYAPDDQTLPGPFEPMPEGHDFSAGRAVTGLNYDHCFAGVTSPAVLHYPDHQVRIDFDPILNHGVVYIPADEDFFCFEPVSHMNDGFNRDPDGMTVLAPGDTLHAAMCLTVLRP